MLRYCNFKESRILPGGFILSFVPPCWLPNPLQFSSCHSTVCSVTHTIHRASTFYIFHIKLHTSKYFTRIKATNPLFFYAEGGLFRTTTPPPPPPPTTSSLSLPRPSSTSRNKLPPSEPVFLIPFIATPLSFGYVQCNKI